MFDPLIQINGRPTQLPLRSFHPRRTVNRAAGESTMSYSSHIEAASQAPFSPLVLSDRLLTLAQDADQAGYRGTAEHLLNLASKVLDKPTRTRRTSTH
jgi:hypothetical protein